MLKSLFVQWNHAFLSTAIQALCFVIWFLMALSTLLFTWFIWLLYEVLFGKFYIHLFFPFFDSLCMECIDCFGGMSFGEERI